MAFVEYARTHGDFALAGAAVVVAPGGHAAVALLGAGPGPVRAAECERAVAAGADAAEAAELAGTWSAVRPVRPASGRQSGGDDYQRALVTTLVARALERVRS